MIVSCDDLAINGIIGKISPTLIDNGDYTVILYAYVDYYYILIAKGFHIETADKESIENIKGLAQNNFNEFIEKLGC